jgi:hypothetical protein
MNEVTLQTSRSGYSSVGLQGLLVNKDTHRC